MCSKFVLDFFVKQIQCDDFDEKSFMPPIYRGQANCEWKLTSSLERIAKQTISVRRYYDTIDSAKPKINAHLKTNFKRYHEEEPRRDSFDEHCILTRGIFDVEYMSFLRHHAYPTPLIDWTISPYIALFFACENWSELKSDGVIFQYFESRHQSLTGEMPLIHSVPEYINSHKRHYTQKSQYLAAVQYVDGGWIFPKFEDSIAENLENLEMKRIVIPASEKRKILVELDKMNINSFTIYMDDDSFIRSIASDHLVAENRWFAFG